MNSQNFRSYSSRKLLVFSFVLIACAIISLFHNTGISFADEKKVPEGPVTVRPISDFKVVVPFSSVSKIFENSKMVMITYQELSELIEKNNLMISDRYKDREKPGSEKNPPAEFVISSVSYKFIKDRENILCSVDCDISVLTDKKFVLIPLFEGEMAMNDAVVDDTIPVMVVEPALYQVTPVPSNYIPEMQMQNQQAEQRQSLNNISNLAPPSAPRGKAGNRYSLLLKGKGSHQLNIRFLMMPKKDGATYSFSLVVPRCPKNSALFLHDERDAVIKITPAIGLRSFYHPETKNQAAEAEFGFTDSISLSYFAISREEKKLIEDASKPVAPEAETGSIELASTSEVEAPVKYEEEAPAVSSNIKSIFSIGDGMIRGNHEITFNIIKGKISRFSLDVPAGTEIEDVLSDSYDKRQIQEFKNYSSVEIFLKSPAASEFAITLTSITRIEDGKYEVTLPEITLHNMESERGHIAVCALTNIKIEVAGEPFNLERLDAQELPDRIKFSVISPILYAFKYFKHPYRAKLKLTKYSDSKVLSSLVRSSSINTILTSQGAVISNYDFVLKNNGLPFLKMIPESTVEILDSAVNGKPVKASYDEESNLKIPIIKSVVRDDDVLDFPVNFKTSGTLEKFSSFGSFNLRIPRIELPVMFLKWRVFTPEGYVFFNFRGAPDLSQQPPAPLIYQIPVNVINGIVKAVQSDYFMSFVFLFVFILICVVLAYVAYVGGEKVYNSDIIPATINLLKTVIFWIFGFLRSYAASIIILFLIGGLLAAISVPNFNRSRVQAKKKSCVANMKTIEGAMELYQMENGATGAMSVNELVGKGYLKAEPRCPESMLSYRIVSGMGVGVTNDVICEIHGNLSLQETSDKTKGIGGDSRGGSTGYSRQREDEISSNYEKKQDYANAPAPSMPAAQSAAEGRMMSKEEDSKDNGILYKGKPGKVTSGKKYIQKPTGEKGIFSVPIKLPKTIYSNVLEKQFVIPNENINLNVSYLSVRSYKTLAVILFIVGLILPYMLTRTMEGGEFLIIAMPFTLAALMILEIANFYLPTSAWYSQLGILSGVLAFALFKLIAKLTDPDNMKKIAALLEKSVPPPAAPQQPAAPASGGGTGAGNLTVLIFIIIALTLLLPSATLAKPFASGEKEFVDITYNPATMEIQTFYTLESEVKAGQKVVFMPYADLKNLIDSVNAMQFIDESSENAIQKPLYKALIKKISISGSVNTETADLDIEYFIDVYDDNYTVVDLFSGNAALTRIESFMIKPFNFGFYDMPARYIDKLEYIYKSKPERERFSQYRLNKQFEKVSEYKNFKMSPDRDKYSAMFENAGEYLVRASLKTSVIYSDNSYYFELHPQKSPCMKISLKTPREYDIYSDNLIVESQTREDKTGEIITKGSLIPADYYNFKLSLAEEVRRERMKKQKEDEERARLAREKLLGKTDEVRIITKKVEPRVNLTATSRLTVDEERFASSINLNYRIQNTELRELSYSIPSSMMITQVEGAGIYDWKVSNATSSETRVLSVMFKNPRQGTVNIKIGFESEIANMKVPAVIPWITPLGVTEFKGYIAIDSAINAEISVVNESGSNLVMADEREISGLPQGYASSPLLFLYKYTKPPANIALVIKKHMDVASIPCAVDVASYRTFVSKDGYAITRASYHIRNNNVQFLEVRMPENSEPASLKVGEKLMKPGAGLKNSVFIPLLKSPLEGSEFKAFAVEFVYITKLASFETFGRSRFELPKISVICSKINWEFYFVDGYNILQTWTNLRQENIALQNKFMDETVQKVFSVNEIYNMQYRKMVVQNMKSIEGAEELYQPEAQSRLDSPRDGGSSSASAMAFGGTSRGLLPVPIDIPASSNLLYFAGESLEKVENIDGTSTFFIEFSYYSKSVFELLTFIGYLLAILVLMSIVKAITRTKAFKGPIVFTVISGVYAGILEYLSPGAFNYFLLGLVMAVIIMLTYKIVKIDREERQILKIK